MSAILYLFYYRKKSFYILWSQQLDCNQSTFLFLVQILVHIVYYLKNKSFKRKERKKRHLRRAATNHSSVSDSVGGTGKCQSHQPFSLNRTQLPFFHSQTYSNINIFNGRLRFLLTFSNQSNMN